MQQHSTQATTSGPRWKQVAKPMEQNRAEFHGCSGLESVPRAIRGPGGWSQQGSNFAGF
jgi:hypothetical protein